METDLFHSQLQVAIQGAAVFGSHGGCCLVQSDNTEAHSCKRSLSVACIVAIHTLLEATKSYILLF